MDLIKKNIIVDASCIMAILEPNMDEIKSKGFEEIKLSDLMIKTNDKGKNSLYVTKDNGTYPYDYIANALKVIKIFSCDYTIYYKKCNPIFFIFENGEELKHGIAIAHRITDGDD
jgi:hypothetical protein